MNTAALLHDLLANAPYQRAGAPYRGIELSGPEAGEFLHRLCSQDVLGMADGGLAPAAFLDAKGKLLATCLVARLGGSYWLETRADGADRLLALLERYHFTEKLTIAPSTLWCHEVVDRMPQPGNAAARQGDAIVLQFARRGVAMRRTHLPGPAAGAPVAPPDAAGMRPLADELAECLRLLSGFVRVGVDTEPTTLALEADLDDHISTTKGCYTGQEIVARIHTYGHTNRKLCLLWLAKGAAITSPQPLHEVEDQLAVGRVMHAVPIPGRDERLGVGFLPRDFQALGTRLALADGAAVEVIGYAPLSPPTTS